MDNDMLGGPGEPAPVADAAAPVPLTDDLSGGSASLGASTGSLPEVALVDDQHSSPSMSPVMGSAGGVSDLGSEFGGGVAVENSVLCKWQEEHARALLEKREKSEQRTADLRSKARQEIEDFMDDRAAKIERSRKENRNGEEEVKRDLHEGGGGAWESIAKIVDLSAGKTKGRDVSRMRQLLLEAKGQK